MSPDQRSVKQHLEELYRTHHFQPPNRQSALQSTGVPEKMSEEIFRLLVDEGILLRVDQELYYHKETLEEITQKVVDFLTHHSEMTVGDLKTLLQLSRKYAVPILMYLDATGVTIRKGDTRMLRRKSG